MHNIINMYFATHKTCNLNCRYCYIPQYNKTEKKISDSEILASLERFISKVENEEYQVGTFCLHGTEPSLLKPESIVSIIDIMDSHWSKNSNTKNKVAIQTNGVRINNDYLDVIKKGTVSTEKLRIGFSIDPPGPVHDIFRDNSFSVVEANYENALKRGFPVSVLSVVTRETLKHMDGFTSWMKKQLDRKEKSGNPYKVKLKFATGEMAISEEEIKRFAYHLLDNNMTELVQILTPGYCLQSGNECMWFEFDVDGNAYSCNKNYMEEGIFANWQEDSFDKIFEKREKLFFSYPEHTECSDCEYEYICNSGCPTDRHSSGIMKGKAHECNLIKIIYSEIQDRGFSIAEFFNAND